MVRLPAEYQEVEYLETDGSGGYIDSGIECTSDLVVDFGFNALTDVNAALCGGIGVSDAPIYFRHHASPTTANNAIYWIQYNSSSYASVLRVLTFGKKRQLFIDPVNGTYELSDGESKYTGSFSPITEYHTTGKSYGILGRIASNGVIQSRPSRCYYFKFYRNNVLIGNFIPCYRKSDNEPGMYDTVSKTFFTNSGTGTFLVGNDVSWDTASLLERRRQILLNTPHIETVSGSMASFNTDMASKLKECKVYFSPIQEGTGDPSPDNVRPISGWDGIILYLSGSDTSNPTTLTIPFNRTIYGGYVDLVRGEVVETDYLLAVDEDTTAYNVRSNAGHKIVGYYDLPFVGKKMPFLYYSHGAIVEASTATYNYQAAGTVANYPYNGNAIRAAIAATSDITSVSNYSGWLASVGTLQIAYKLLEPISYTLTPETIKTLKGINNIWSNANGNIEVSFYTH